MRNTRVSDYIYTNNKKGCLKTFFVKKTLIQKYLELLKIKVENIDQANINQN